MHSVSGSHNPGYQVFITRSMKGGEPNNAGQVKILIVEDESLISYDYRLQLESSGFAVVGTARNATDAFESIKYQRPDVILMDIYIKGSVNGLELAKEIHKQDRIPILFVTASSRPDIISEIQMLTNCRMISKPVNSTLLEDTLRSMKLAV